MAKVGRPLGVAHDDLTRAKIKTSQLVNRLQDHALARPGVDMSKTQIQAAMILLRKVLPDLMAVAVQAAGTGSFLIMGERESVDSEAWQQQHGLPDPETPDA